MDLQRISAHKSAFDGIVRTIDGDNSENVEVWFARDLQEVLGYARWENFQVAISRAMESCKQQNINVDDHFREVTKMVGETGGNRELSGSQLRGRKWMLKSLVVRAADHFRGPTKMVGETGGNRKLSGSQLRG